MERQQGALTGEFSRKGASIARRTLGKLPTRPAIENLGFSNVP